MDKVNIVDVKILECLEYEKNNICELYDILYDNKPDINSIIKIRNIINYMNLRYKYFEYDFEKIENLYIGLSKKYKDKNIIEHLIIYCLSTDPNEQYFENVILEIIKIVMLETDNKSFIDFFFQQLLAEIDGIYNEFKKSSHSEYFYYIYENLLKLVLKKKFIRDIFLQIITGVKILNETNISSICNNSFIKSKYNGYRYKLLIDVLAIDKNKCKFKNFS